MGVIHIAKDVADQLREGGVSLEPIDADIIDWSHHHFEHVGDPSGFPSSTALIVGPGFKSDKTTFPGHPNPDAETIERHSKGAVIELNFSSVSMKIGRYPGDHSAQRALANILLGFFKKLDNWDSAGYKSLVRGRCPKDFLMGIE